MTPVSWRQIPLGSAVELVSGTTPKGIVDHLIEDSGEPGAIPFFKVGDMNRDATRLAVARVYVRRDVADRLRMRVIPAGAVVFPKAGGAIATNKKRIVTRAGAIDLNCMAAVPGPSVDPVYLRLWFESLDLSRLSDGSVLPQLSKKRMASLPLPLPDMAEQRRIVEILEDHLSRLNSATQLTEHTQRRLSRLRDAGAQTTLAEARRSAVSVRLGDLEQSGRKIAYGVLVPGSHVEDGVPLIRIGDLQEGRIATSDMKRIAPDIAGRFKRTFVHGGEVLLSLVGTIGRTAVVQPSLAGANVARAICVLPLASAAHPEFVSTILSAPEIQRDLNRQAHEVARKTLNLEDVKRLVIPLPDLPEQLRILEDFRVTKDSIERLGGAVGYAHGRAGTLRRSLLAAAFAGRLTSGRGRQGLVKELVDA